MTYNLAISNIVCNFTDTKRHIDETNNVWNIL